jgi:hypothetical protein
MKVDDSARTALRFCPVVENMVAHERTIVPQAAIVRARALARARAALRTGDPRLLAVPPQPTHGRRLQFAAAASVALLASAAAAVQLAWPPSSAPPPGARSPQATRNEQVVLPSAAAEPAPPPTPKAAPGRSTPFPSTVPTKTPGVGHHTNQPEKDANIFDELRLLESAQKSEARGDFVAALAVTTDHERRYPAGQLCEEREVLQLRALVGLGRGSEARQAAAQFRRNYPRSILLRTLDEMLTASP